VGDVVEPGDTQEDGCLDKDTSVCWCDWSMRVIN